MHACMNTSIHWPIYLCVEVGANVCIQHIYMNAFFLPIQDCFWMYEMLGKQTGYRPSHSYLVTAPPLLQHQSTTMFVCQTLA